MHVPCVVGSVISVSFVFCRGGETGSVGVVQYTGVRLLLQWDEGSWLLMSLQSCTFLVGQFNYSGFYSSICFFFVQDLFY